MVSAGKGDSAFFPFPHTTLVRGQLLLIPLVTSRAVNTASREGAGGIHCLAPGWGSTQPCPSCRTHSAVSSGRSQCLAWRGLSPPQVCASGPCLQQKQLPSWEFSLLTPNVFLRAWLRQEPSSLCPGWAPAVPELLPGVQRAPGPCGVPLLSCSQGHHTPTPRRGAEASFILKGKEFTSHRPTGTQIQINFSQSAVVGEN